MRSRHVRKIRFIGKSLLWSLGLYILCMTIINWDELSNGKANKVANPIVQTVPQPVNNPTADPKPDAPESSISAFSHVVHTTGTFLSHLLKVVSIFKK